MKTRHKVVSVLWGDAFVDTEDFKEEDAKSVEPVWRATVGFLITRNQHGIVLATDEYQKKEDGVNGKMFVPKGMIKKVTKYEAV